MNYDLGTNGTAKVWTFRTQAIFATDEAEARTLITSQALRDVPNATVEIMSSRKTPTGRYSFMVRRVRA